MKVLFRKLQSLCKEVWDFYKIATYVLGKRRRSFFRKMRDFLERDTDVL
jgi:hypothetical protein